MDYQAAGLEDTIKTLDQAGIRHVGAGRTIEEARRPEILDVKGQRIAYLGYYDGEFQAAGEGIAGTNSRQNDRVAADIKAIRSQVDWIVVNYHWGEELAKYPGDYQMDLAHFTIDQGADLVVGHHPHVLQGAEIYKGRPIVYSLGNFIFGGKSVSDYDTAVLKVALKDNQMKVEFLPVEVRGFQPKVVSGDRGTEILHQIENVSDIFHEPMKSSVVLDAKTNTTVTAPTANPTAVQSPQPASPEAIQPSDSPSPANSSSLTPVAPNSGTPITSPRSPSDKTPAAPWKDDSFISTPSPSPSTLPLESPTSDSTPSPSMPPNQQGDASAPGVEPASIAPSPANSLEPMKKRYADSGSVKVAAASVTPRE